MQNEFTLVFPRSGTAAAAGKYRKGSCWSGHCCGSGEIQKRLLLERALLRQRGNIEKAPAGAGTAAAVGKYREGSCWSGHCCGSEEKTAEGDSCGGVGLLGKRRGNGPLWVDWVMKGRGGGIG